MPFARIRQRLGRGVSALPWQRFTGELVTIVLGVFLALLGQEWLNARFERKQMRFAEQDLRNEIVISAQNAYERLALSSCLREELANLAGALNESGSAWTPVKRNFIGNPSRLRAIKPVYVAPTRPWNSDAWDTAIASNSLTYMPVDRVVAYLRVYEAIVKLRELQDTEFQSGARLSLLSLRQPLPVATRASLLADLGQVDATAAFMANVSEALLYQTSLLGYRLTDEEKAGFGQRIELARSVRGSCVSPPPLDL